MTSSEPLNFGRKIKELKRLHKKGYAELTAGLKISRERIIQLEENEREPNEVERRRFAAFYNLPVEEFGVYEGGSVPPPVAPRPAPAPGPSYGNSYGAPSYQPAERQGGAYQPPAERSGGYQTNRPSYGEGNTRPNYGEGGGRPNYGEGGGRPNYGEGGGRPSYNEGNTRPGYNEGGGRPNYGEGGGRPGYNEGNTRPNYGEGGGRPNYGEGGGRPNYGEGGGRPNYGGGNRPGGGQRPGGFGGGGGRPGPGGGRPGGNGTRQDQPPRREGSRPSEGQTREPKSNDPKQPVMKYTAEQLGDIESAYLRKQRDLKVPLTFTFLNGKEYTGVVLDFTPFTVHIMDSESGQEIILRKLAMAYYRKADAIAEARAAQAAAGGDNSARGED